MIGNMKRPLARALQGAALSVGSPLGWLALRMLGGADAGAELAAHFGVYAYMLVGTALVFAAFGAYVGVQEAEHLENSLHDELTGLYNTRYFWRRLREEHAFALRHGRPLAVVIGDIDWFKRVNDTHGHVVGDRVLAGVAGALLGRRRRGDTLARVGGEEFGVILPETSLEDARQLAERMRVAVASVRFDADHRSLAVTMSFGAAALAPERPVAPGTLYELADAALYQAKRSGRDRVATTPAASEPAATVAAP